jgi:OmpA family
MLDDLALDALKIDKVFGLVSGQKHKIKATTKYSYHIIEVDDINFHFDSAVLLSDYGVTSSGSGSTEKKKTTGLDVLYECYKFLEEKDYKKKILIAGHTDKKGSESYNLSLSQKRSRNVFYLFKGERTDWINSSDDKHQIEDIQQILKWISFNFHYDCDPGEKTNSMNPETESATLKFQKRYNQDFVKSEIHKDKFDRRFTKIEETGRVGKQTWGAFYDMYVLKLLNRMGINEKGLNDVQSKLEFVKKDAPCPAPVVGCGENFPASKSKTEDENSADRRVEVLFFDPGNEPQLKCTPNNSVCYPKKCDLYNTTLYKRIPVILNPVPPPVGGKVKVFLKFAFKMPDDKNRNLPQGFPVKIIYKDGTEEPVKFLDRNSTLSFEVEKSKESFTLEFNFDEENYVTTPAPDNMSGAPDVLITESQLDDHISRGNRVFLLPKNFSLKTSNWLEPEGTSNYNDTNKDFEDLNNASLNNIGSEASPILLVLSPHWQFLRFEFFDRFFGHSDHNHKPIGIPAVLAEGFRNKSDTEHGHNSKPDTQSNWMANESDSSKSSQALPWIIQKKNDGTDDSRPNTDILLQFKTQPDSFVISESSTSRKIERVTDDDKLKPGAERLKYYDLPELWKSKKYFTHLDENTGKPFDQLTNDEFEESTSADKPLIFSLDDIVLTNAALHKHNIGNNDRVTLFFHQFKKPDFDTEKPFSDEGIYNPGTQLNNFFPFSDIQVIDHNYIVDYPNWIRLIILQGNLFEVFNKRTPDISGNDIVGARAAVRWVDNSSIHMPVHRELHRSPDRQDFDSDIKKRFFSFRPFFSQRDTEQYEDLRTGTYHDLENNHNIPTSFTLGRYDMAFFRCCDIKDDKEFAVNLHYIKYHLDFSKAPQKIKDEHGNEVNFDHDKYRKNIVKNIPKRWNGRDENNSDIYNSGKIFIKPTPESDQSIIIKPYFFVQEVIQNTAHFLIKVQEKRSNMDTVKGVGEWEPDAAESNSDGWFVGAHETGHANSLPDEYNETGTSCSYDFPGFACNLPGDPFSIISSGYEAMMSLNKFMDLRYFWHAAEFIRKATDIPMIVEEEKGNEALQYQVHNHPDAPIKNFTYLPLFAESNASGSPRGKFDLYLYQLGKEKFPSKIVEGNTFDGLLLAVVKIRFNLHDANKQVHVEKPIHGVQLMIDFNYNDPPTQYEVKGDIADVHFDHCLVYFYPRFLIDNLVIELSDADNRSFLENMGFKLTPDDNPTSTDATQGKYNVKVNEIERDHPHHFKVNVRKTLTTGWASSTHLNIGVDVTDESHPETLGNEFYPFFADMLGLVTSSTTRLPSKGEILSKIVQKAIPNAEISEIPLSTPPSTP